MASILQVFDSIVHNYNNTKGLKHELNLGLSYIQWCHRYSNVRSRNY